MDRITQAPILLEQLNWTHGSSPPSKCTPIWDPIEARFSTCFLPVITAIPAIIAAFVVLLHALRLLSAYRPRWTNAFITETKERSSELAPASNARPHFWTYVLLSISLIGLGLQIVTVFVPTRQILALYPSIAWLISAMIVISERPKTAPISLLVLYIGLLVAQLVLLTHTHSSLQGKDTPTALTVVMAVFGIVSILIMPYRDPVLPKDDIGHVSDAPTTALRSPEDDITPWQYLTVSWMAPLVSVGCKRQLQDEDVWDLPYTFKHSRLHDAFRQLRGSVLRRLLHANGIDVVIITTLGIVELIAQLAGPVLLQRLLFSMDDNGSPRSAAITYAFLTLVVRLIGSQTAVIKLWHSRRSYERSRGEMITMLYGKTLNRKILSAPQDAKRLDNANGHSNGTHENGTNGSLQVKKESRRNIMSILRTVFRVLLAPFTSNKAETNSEKAEEGASMGKILNIMRNDAYEVAQRFWDFPDVVTKPLGVVLAVILIWKILGWACLIGAVTIVIAQLLNIVLSRILILWEKKRRTATDSRLQKINQFVEAIRHLRWYGWQEHWLQDILEARQHELNLRIVTFVLQSFIILTNHFASSMFPVVAFYAFTLLAGKPLRIDIIFPAIDLFNMLSSFLRALPDLFTMMLNAHVAMGRIEMFMKEPEKEHSEMPLSATSQPGLKGASFSWPGSSKAVLYDVTLSFPVGLTVVYGEVAAGKTALLQALLGELDRTDGDLLRPDTMVGYCAQSPWLQSMSIRDNILFSSPYDEVRYKQVLDACALLPDMASFKNGDLSNIGENGIGLSGGQKARVALARAVYSQAKIIFLDDPLSALDHQTAESIVRKCISGPLFEGRTTVLVTHRTDLCNGIADQWVEVAAGRVTVHEPTADTSNALQRMVSVESVDEDEDKKREEEAQAAIPEKFMEDEHRAHGGVKLRVYWQYIKAGKLKLWLLSVIFLPIFRFGDVAEIWYIKSWGEGYNSVKASVSGPFDFLPPPQENVRPWILGFFILGCILTALYYIIQILLRAIGYQASKSIFIKVMDRVAHAPFRFYDTTPVGRLMNRLTSDMNTIDGHLTMLFTLVIWQVVGWISAVIVIASSTPIFLIFGFLLATVFVLTFRRFLPTSQSLRRLEMVSLSPLMSNFGALVEGLTTVRAFCVQSRFQERVIEVVDNFQSKDHFYWSLQAWLMFRFDAISACSMLFMTLLAIWTGISPGLTAFVLIAASKFVTHTHNLCKLYGMLEMDFTSVERVVELLDLEKEPTGVVEPPAWWPSFTGDIVFEDVTIRYAPHLDPALSNVSFRLPAGSNTAVIGRTGSGKSTLALSLLATMTPESGRILIDGVDLATVDRQTLRNRVTFLAQEPVLFPGTMRQNLDPLSQFPDTAITHVLSKIAGRHNWTLSTPIDAGGRSLSQGQRQLVGLARAMLRRSAVIILDEATASIDMETAQRIQGILREEMRESTVITIAHRLEAVKNADFCVVLGKGKLVKAGKAADMLREGAEGDFKDLLA